MTLKRLAVEWALAHRLSLCAAEVRLPRCNYRADVAAATPRIAAPNALTAVFECKSNRSDFLRDGADETRTRHEVGVLSERVQQLREMIAHHCPDLRLGDELFPQFEAIDLRGVKHETHRKLTSQLRTAQTRLLEGTKFARLARWRCASLLYLVADDEIVCAHEVPDGWGLLVREGDALELRVKPCLNETRVEDRIGFLERIAAAAARESSRGLGLPTWRNPRPDS